MITTATWNPSTNAWVCHVSDPEHDWTAVCVDGIWYSVDGEVYRPETIVMLDAAVARAMGSAR